jgi:hypothetical protein
MGRPLDALVIDDKRESERERKRERDIYIYICRSITNNGLK